jgi:hypothetical protein
MPVDERPFKGTLKGKFAGSQGLRVRLFSADFPFSMETSKVSGATCNNAMARRLSEIVHARRNMRRRRARRATPGDGSAIIPLTQ